MTHDLLPEPTVDHLLRSFGGGDDDGSGLFLVSPASEPTRRNEFCANVLVSINELLDEAVLADGMGGNRAWLVQHLLSAFVATQSSTLE